MAPWGFFLTAAACAAFPQHRALVLVASAVGSLVRGGRKRRAALLTPSAQQPGSGASGTLLQWADVDCRLVDKKTGKEQRLLLAGQCGAAKPGRVLAIMGPSGAGKTTLLNVLAGQLRSTGASRTELSGTILFNGVPQGQAKHRQAYIRQEDSFFSQLTVRETLLFAAKLSLPEGMPEAEKEQRVDDLLNSTGLAKVKATPVGSAKVRGVSGGERKRLSIACELLGNPSLIFADEPTTGLDAFQAERVMDNLRSLAHKQGKTVVCSIHQPRGSVYDMFDDIILLAEGRTVYSGPAKAQALDYFKQQGYPCLENNNPAEHLADLVSIDHTTPETEEQSLARVHALVALFQEQYPAPVLVPASDLAQGAEEGQGEGEGEGAQGSSGPGEAPARLGFVPMFKLLLSRAWKQTTRDKQTNFVRAAMNITSALIFGSVFWRMGMSQTSIQDRLGLLQVAAINTAMASLTKMLNVFPGERQIVQRELAADRYTVAAYFSSKLVAELPIGALFPALFGVVMYPMTGLHKSLGRFAGFLLMSTIESFAASAMGLTVGCIAPSQEAASALGPSVMTVFIVFGGYYVNASNTPFIFRWIPNVSLIRWGFQGFCANEFRGLEFEASSPVDLRSGEQVLQRLSFEADKEGGSDGILALAVRKELRIMAFFYWASLYLLQRQGPKFVALDDPRSCPVEVLDETNGEKATEVTEVIEVPSH